MNEKKFVYRPFLLLLTFVTYVLAYFYPDIMGERSIILHIGGFNFNLRFFYIYTCIHWNYGVYRGEIQ